jgi:hypothetical protein
MTAQATFLKTSKPAAKAAAQLRAAPSPHRISKTRLAADPALRADLTSILSILRPRRATRTKSHATFLRNVIVPVFGKPDMFGNFYLTVGDAKPEIAFLAHHDTVESASGEVGLWVGDNLIIGMDPADKSSVCIGADDGAGIWLILEMIKAKVPGLYVIFDQEESGMIGSRAFADSKLGGDILKTVTRVISFDRHNHNGNEVITHMAGQRTCSETFAVDLCMALGLGYKPSELGGVTDALELLGVGGVREATNITVAYANLHSAHETLDVGALRELRDTLIALDWSILPAVNDPSASAYDDRWGNAYYDTPSSKCEVSVSDEAQMRQLVREYPGRVAALLIDLGIDLRDLEDAVCGGGYF